MQEKEKFFSEKKILYIIFSFFFLNESNANINEEIIYNLKNTKNFSFNFKQTINEKIETGNCIIKYPKKIFCSYNNDKIMISNGHTLIIKNLKSKLYYMYPLRKTPLELILDKKYLIKKITETKGKIIDDKFFNIFLEENDNRINIFFDLNNYNLVGWQTEDIYSNLVITYISRVETNKEINGDIFKINELN